MFWRRGKKEKKNTILFLIDWENIIRNIISGDPENFSLSLGFDNLMKNLAQLGKIGSVFVFTPPHIAPSHLELLVKLRFFPIFCPKVKDKKGEESDSTDNMLMDFGRKMIEQMPKLTHLCLASGDKDFLPLIREAIHRGLKIIIVAGDTKSLSDELIDLADKNPATGEKMVFLFSATV